MLFPERWCTSGIEYVKMIKENAKYCKWECAWYLLKKEEIAAGFTSQLPGMIMYGFRFATGSIIPRDLSIDVVPAIG